MGKTNKNSIAPFKRKAKENTAKTGTTNIIKKTNTSSGKVSKKAKRQNKKSHLINKLMASHKAKEKIKKAKFRSQKAIVGDVDPLLNALADIETSLSQGKEDEKLRNKEGKKKLASEKQRCNSDMNDIALFKKVTAHEKFIEDPLQAITDHVKQMFAMEIV